MTYKKILVIAALLGVVLITAVWGARSPKKPSTAAQEDTDQHDHTDHDHKEHAHRATKEPPGHRETLRQHMEHEADEHAEKAIVRLSEAQREEHGIELAVAQPGAFESRLTFPGSLGLNTERLVRVVPRMPGIVREVRKRLGDVVRAGEVLAVIDSRELADAKAGYLAAGERLTLAESTFAREKSLWEKHISAEQDYLSARQALTEARIELHAAKHKLQALGLSEPSLKQARARPEGLLTRYEIVSPLAGTIIEKQITVGELLKDDAEVFVVADLSTVWVTLQVPPTALPLVKKGQRVMISAGQSIAEAVGTVSYVSPILHEDTRTAVTRVELSNQDGNWRPGLFVTATIVAGKNQAAVLIPKSAIQTIDGKPSVFVQTDEGFEARPITLGRANDSQVEITRGLSSGERYATTETFILKAELGKGEASHQH